MPDVRCPHCDQPMVDVRRKGHGRPLGWVRPHPDKPNTVQVVCPSCHKVFDWEDKRLVLFHAA